MAATENLNSQQFYHGTDRDIEGDMITPGHARHSKFTSKPATHVFFTDNRAEAEGWGPQGRTFQVEPTGDYELRGTGPGEAFRNYASPHPLRIVKDVTTEK